MWKFLGCWGKAKNSDDGAAEPVPKTHSFSLDQPQDNPDDPEQDSLGRKDFCRAIAHPLATWDEAVTFVAGLCGDWGSGKTTIRNFIEHYLKKAAKPPHVLRFNPWEWSGQDRLFEAFLWALYGVFNKTDIAKKTTGLATKWKAFASFLKVGESGARVLPRWLGVLGVILPIIGVKLTGNNEGWWPAVLFGMGAAAFIFALISGVLDGLVSWLESLASVQAKTLDQLRAAVAKELGGLDRPIIVFIDDIDRLTKSEIALLFQLVKANVQLPRVVFVLMYQKSIVTTALGEIVADDGDKYLRKIVQVEFEVPQPSDLQIQSFLIKGIKQVLDERVRHTWTDFRWDKIFQNGLWPYFENLRDIKRFLGNFEFYAKIHIQDGVLVVDPIDLIAIETLRLFDHDAYVTIKNEFHWKTKSRYERPSEKEPTYEQRLAEVASRNNRPLIKQKALVRILGELFPKTAVHGNFEQTDLIGGRINSRSHFEKFFRASIDPSEVTAVDWHAFLAILDDRPALVSFLTDLASKGKISDFIDFLAAGKDQIPTSSMLPVVTALLDVGELFPPVVQGTLQSAGLTTYQLIKARLSREAEDLRSNLLLSAFKQTTGYSMPMRIMGFEDAGDRVDGPGHNHVALVDQLPEFRKVALELLRKAAVENRIRLDCLETVFVLYHWKTWASEVEIKEWSSRAIENPKEALLLTRNILSTVPRGGNPFQPRDLNNDIGPYLDLTKLTVQIAKIPEAELGDQDKVILKFLRAAIAEGTPKTEA